MTPKHFARIAIYAIGVAMFLSLRFVAEARGFSEHDLLTLKIRATVIKAKSIDEVIVRLVEYRVPIGIELGGEKLTPPRNIDLDLPETNLGKFLDSVIAKDPRYTWKLEGGVVHVWPIKDRDTLVATLLDTKIGHFSFTEGVSRMTSKTKS